MEENKEEPFVSVIVPIYNVEKYVRRCLDSLRGQTLKQIEVICIDDGSTDSSGAIADEYENTDGWPQFRIIHHGVNRGLSVARNRGIDASVADWIMFVDSDDWVGAEFCRIPYETAIKYDCDLVIFQADTVIREKKRSKPYSGPVGIVDEMTAHEYGSSVAWNKLYRERVFNNIQYPEGRVYEDVATTHKLVHKSKQILLLNVCLYHHILRKGSISRTHTISNKRDGLVSSMERKNDLISYGYSEEKLKDSLCGAAIGYMASSYNHKDALYKKAVEIVNAVEEPPEFLSRKQRIALRAWKMNYGLFILLSKVSGRLGR